MSHEEATMTTALLYVPKSAKRGEIITLKAVASHPMETGYRREVTGKIISRDILRQLTCHYDGAEIFRADFFPAIAANPFIAFTTIATRSGTITFRWVDDAGTVHTEKTELTVSP
jgi:sulfur-oxidizing protein SoxZ